MLVFSQITNKYNGTFRCYCLRLEMRAVRSRISLKSVLTAIHRWPYGTTFFKKNVSSSNYCLKSSLFL